MQMDCIMRGVTRVRLELPHHPARRGLRLTGPRRAVLDVLAESRVPMTAVDIHARLSPRRANIVSVYRTLHLLTRLSLVRSTDTTRRSRRYELSEPFTGHHHHLISSVRVVGGSRISTGAW
jgi:Fe2+ or Zn2+ uptake regulation protein